jgi:CubicO group peptidase (beta-lactamase class C family)
MTRGSLNLRNIRMKKIVLFTGFVLVLITLMLTSFARPAQAAGSDSYQDIDTYIEKRLEQLNIPGASWVIVENDQIVHAKGFGVTGPSGEVPSSQTPYFIGSLTKSITALAVMQLVENGAIALDDPVQHYLPWFTLADPQAAAQITIRHLLNQTSGLPQIPGMIGLSNFDNTTGAAERQARALATLELPRPVGSAWEYSNINFNLLGLIIEAASGQSYAQYIKDHVFAPLQMDHSFTTKEAAKQDGLATGHMQWFGFPVAVPALPVPQASLPSGQLIASTEDLGHYLIAQLNQGEYDDTLLLSAQGVAQMHQQAVDTGWGVSYSMGWFVKETEAYDLVFHYGEVPDFFAYLAVLPEDQRGLALLVNTNQHMFTYALWSTAENAAMMLAGIPPQPNAWGILPWVLRALLFLPVLQSVLIFRGFRRIKNWQNGERPLPGATRMWLLHILLPAICNLMIITSAVAILASGMLKFIMLFMGDIASVILLCGGIALVWVFVRTPLVLRVLRTPLD